MDIFHRPQKPFLTNIQKGKETVVKIGQKSEKSIGVKIDFDLSEFSSKNYDQIMKRGLL